MIKDVRFWAASVAASSLGFVFLTADRTGEQLWNAVRLPLVLLAGGTWVGFVLTIIARSIGGTPTPPSGGEDVDLTDAATPDETVVATAQLSAKLFVAVLAIGCLALAVWDGLLRTRAHSDGPAYGRLRLSRGFLPCQVASAPSCVFSGKYLLERKR